MDHRSTSADACARGLRDSGSEPDPRPPHASIDADCEELECSVDGSPSQDPDGQIAKYEWDFGDGASRTGVTAQHTYANAGAYTITLTVTDNDGLTDDAARVVDVVGPFRVSWASEVTDLYVQEGQMVCEFTIAVSASGGRSGDAAVWRPSAGEWRDPASGERYTFSLTTSDLLDYFGADRITTGETLQAFRYAEWDRPFLLLYSFRYESPNGTLRSDDVWVDCTP